MVPTLCQKWFLKTRFFVEKLKISCSLDHTIFFSNFTSMRYKHSLRNVWRDFRLLMSALATVAGKSFNGKFTPKIDFPIRYFMLSLLILTLKVLSLSIHYLISIWTTNLKFEQNRMVRTIQDFDLFDKKWLNIFDKAWTPF